MSYISKKGIRWCRDAQQQDFGEAEHERTANGPSCGWVRGKGCFPSEFSPIAVTVTGCRVTDVILRVIQSPVKGTPRRSWYCRSALLLPILAERPGTSKGGTFSCSERHSLSRQTWERRDEPVCRSWCCTCVSVRHLWIKKYSFQHCQFSTLPTSNTMTGVVLN